MNAVKKVGSSELSGTVPATLTRLMATTSKPSTPPIMSPRNLVPIPVHFTTPRMVCIGTPSQHECIPVFRMASKDEVVDINGVGPGSTQPIFLSASSSSSSASLTPTAVPAAKTGYSSPASSGSVFVGQDLDKPPNENRRKRPATSQAHVRQNKSRGVDSLTSPTDSSTDTTVLSPREQRALRRKEKSRLAAKLRRNQESKILSCLLRALPVSLPEPPTSDGAAKAASSISTTSTPASGLNLEKSGVIRMAGQTLFLYNSLSRVLGTKAVPFISLLSKSLYGLMVHPTDFTVVYASPPLAEALNWPWINMIGVKLESLLDEAALPTVTGETVRLRILEQTTSPTKGVSHAGGMGHNRPLTPLRSPSHSPTVTANVMNSAMGSAAAAAATAGGGGVANSGNPGTGEQVSPLWSPHLYRSSKNGATLTAMGNQVPSCSVGGKSPPYLICTCFAILRIPISTPEDIKPAASASATASAPNSAAKPSEPTPSIQSTPANHLMLYLLHPAPQLEFPRDATDILHHSMTAASSSSSATPISPSTSTTTLPSASTTAAASSSFHRNRERYFANRQRRLLLQNAPVASKPSKDATAAASNRLLPLSFFSTVLDRSIVVKSVDSLETNGANVFSGMTGHSFMDFVAMDDIQRVSLLLGECVQQKRSIWTPVYRLRVPSSGEESPKPSKFITVRTLFSCSYEGVIHCLHQPIGDANVDGDSDIHQVFVQRAKPSLVTTATAMLDKCPIRQAHVPVGVIGGSSTKRPLQVLKLQAPQTPVVTKSTPTGLQTPQPQPPPPTPMQVTPITGASCLAPLTATSAVTRGEAQIVYDSSTCLMTQTLVTTPWFIYTRSFSAPQPAPSSAVVAGDSAKPVVELQPAPITSQPGMPAPPPPPKASFSLLLTDSECKAAAAAAPPATTAATTTSFDPSVAKMPQSCSEPAMSELSQCEPRPCKSPYEDLNLPETLQELDPEILAMLEENEDAKSDSHLTSLSFDDILTSISVTPQTNSGEDRTGVVTPTTNTTFNAATGSFCSSDSSPPSIPESQVPSMSCSRGSCQQPMQQSQGEIRTQEQQQQQQNSHQQGYRDGSMFDDVLGADLPPDTDEFWDVLVTNVMNLPLDTANFPMDVR